MALHTDLPKKKKTSNSSTQVHSKQPPNLYCQPVLFRKRLDDFHQKARGCDAAGVQVLRIYSCIFNSLAIQNATFSYLSKLYCETLNMISALVL